MIFATVGTHKLGFDRLVDQLDAVCEFDNSFRTKILLQRGYSKKSHFLNSDFDFIPHNKIESLILNSSVIITHAGVGSVMAALKVGKTVIACPRYHSLGEHVDDHQVEWCREISRLGWVIPLWKEDKLIDAILSANNFQTTYSSGNELKQYLGSCNFFH